MNRAQFEQVKTAVLFQWPGILQALAGLDDNQVSIKAGKAGTPCPLCGGRDRYSFKDEEKGGWACRKCGKGGDGWALLQQMHGWDFSKAAEEVGRYLGLVNGSYGIDLDALREQQEARRKAVEREDFKKLMEATKKETGVWEASTPAGDHSWIKHKRLSPAAIAVCRQHDTRRPDADPKDWQEVNNRLLIPVFSKSGKRISQQWVAETIPRYYRKGFYQGIPTARGFVEFGAKESDVVLIGESFADADAAFQLAGSSQLAICAFSSGQIPSVVEYAHRKYPESKIIICADNDDAGREAVAKAAARIPGISVSYPPSGKDWSEYFTERKGTKSPLECMEVISMENLEEQTIQPLELQNSIQQEPTFPLLPISLGSSGYDTKINYLIKGWLPAQSFGVLYGASGHFKSFHAVSWACCIAAGREWNGAKVDKGAVLYVVGEGGLGAPRRFRGWEMVHNRSEQLQNLFKIDGAIYPADTFSRECLVGSVKQVEATTNKPVRLIVIDTLARCFVGGDENRSDDMGAFVAGCDYIKQKTGATVLVIHHTGKNAEAGARGSSALRAACDFEFSVRRIPEEQGYIIKHTKSKDSCEQPERAFRLNEHTLFIDDDGDEETTLVANITGEAPPDEPEIKGLSSKNHREFMKSVYGAIKDSGGSIAVSFIRDDLKAKGLRISDFSRWLNDLADKGLIIVSHNGFITLA